MERAIGRSITKGELVHHINFVRDDNAIDNLFLCSGFSEHMKIHSSADRVMSELIRAGKVIFNRETREYEAIL